MQLVRKDVRSLKKQIIAANLVLAGSEAQQFWPIYVRYASEKVKIMDKKFAPLDACGADLWEKLAVAPSPSPEGRQAPWS